MKLISLELKDFRQYYGIQSIDFGNESKKNITIILGENGEGKTGIFRSVIFSLFGEITLSGEDPSARKNRKKNTDLIHLVNINRLEEEKENSVEAYVKIKFSHLGKIYEIKRTITEMMENNGSIIGDDTTEVEMIVTDENGNTSADKITNDNDVQLELSKILDKKLKDFFFFDGEKIESLSKPNKETREEVKSGIIRLLQIDSVTKSIELLKSLEKKQQEKINKNTSNTRLLAKCKELDRLVDEEENVVKEIDDLENELIQCENYISSIETKLAENEDIKKQYEIRENKIKELNGKKELLLHLNQTAKMLIKPQGSNLLLEDYIITVKNFIEQDNISGEYSSKISLQLIDELLNNKVCICGETIDENSKRYNTIIELRKKYKKSELSSFMTTFKYKVNEYYNVKDNFNKEIKELLTQRSDIEDEIESLNKHINDINEDIKERSRNEENLKALEEVLQKHKDKEKHIENKKNQKEYRRKQLGELIKEVKKEIEKEEKQEQTLNKEFKRKEYIVTLKESFNNVLNGYSEEMRSKISQEATRIFKKLISAKDKGMINYIEINENYEIKVLGWNDSTLTADISAGQRQIVSLAFVIALAKVASGSNTEMNVPLFMDTPFGRISGTNRDNLINCIPDLTKQWILLMTDTEFTRAEEKEFKSTNKVSNFYKLNKIRDGYTIIEKVDNFENISVARR